MAGILSDIKIPDSKIAREAAELVRQYETEMLFNHSVRVFVFGAMKGVQQNFKFDSELHYVAALFHDLGLFDAIISTKSGLKLMAPTRSGNRPTTQTFMATLSFRTSLQRLLRHRPSSLRPLEASPQCVRA
jgi:hypothetical protein